MAIIVGGPVSCVRVNYLHMLASSSSSLSFTNYPDGRVAGIRLPCADPFACLLAPGRVASNCHSLVSAVTRCRASTAEAAAAAAAAKATAIATCCATMFVLDNQPTDNRFLFKHGHHPHTAGGNATWMCVVRQDNSSPIPSWAELNITSSLHMTATSIRGMEQFNRR